MNCSFCGKHQDDVKDLIIGPGVYICDECVEKCHEIIVFYKHYNKLPPHENMENIRKMVFDEYWAGG